MAEAILAHCAGIIGTLPFRTRATAAARQEEPMAWTTPTLVEICIGLEINGYLPAEF